MKSVHKNLLVGSLFTGMKNYMRKSNCREFLINLSFRDPEHIQCKFQHPPPQMQLVGANVEKGQATIAPRENKITMLVQRTVEHTTPLQARYEFILDEDDSDETEAAAPSPEPQFVTAPNPLLKIIHYHQPCKYLTMLSMEFQVQPHFPSSYTLTANKI